MASRRQPAASAMQALAARLLRRSVGPGHGRRRVRFGAGRGSMAFRQRYPGNTDVPVQEGLAGHAVAGLELLVGQVFALFGLDGVGMRETLLDPAFAGATQPAAALERNAALLAQRNPQQIAVHRRAGDLAVVGQEGDLDHVFSHVVTGSKILQFAGSAALRNLVSMWPKLVRCRSSLSACSVVSNF